MGSSWLRQAFVVDFWDMQTSSLHSLTSQKGQSPSECYMQKKGHFSFLRFGNFLHALLSTSYKTKYTLQNMPQELKLKLNNETSALASISCSYLRTNHLICSRKVTLFTNNLQASQNEACLYLHGNHNSLQMQLFFFFLIMPACSLFHFFLQK